MRGIRIAARAALVLLAALSLGCHAVSFKDPMHREDEFVDHMRTFTQYMRWGNFNGASTYVVEDQKDEFLSLAPQLSDVRFTDYEILRRDLNEERTKATVDVVLTGYRLSSPVSRTVRLRQEWQRTPSNTWEVRVELGPMLEALGLAAK